ncbi:conserved hypothetical protein [Rippkaea orientalis PCC 8801]|uniref:Phytanoyl-CoA dioxygenase n=1 Tax=Rippkaea orientalis (strain PCC 8801 / RF-1) TaxID=41431 RepID=B7K0R6_RIPO1|nr:phytanoyl-CoA dioxygenase family protein [Rippkaea orientalis]ACK64220.1 conserved hypothetical protein [Rippkaea orientalis PCC 8801]
MSNIPDYINLSYDFNIQGYVIIRNFFSQPEIHHITSCVEPIYQQWLKENRDALIRDELINMHSLTHPKYFQDNCLDRIKFFELIASPKLTNLVENIFDQGIIFHNTQLFFNSHNKSKSPYWHRDLQYSSIDDTIQKKEQKNLCLLHIRIPLVAEKGIELIPETHQRWDSELEKNVRFQLNGHTNSEDLPGTVLIELNVGDILIFDAQMIHRGNYRLNKVRKALDLCVAKQHPLTKIFLDKDLLPNNEEIAFIRNNQWYQY